MNTLLKKSILIFSTFLFLLAPGRALACDTSGFTINDLIDNGDGTFTIQMTIMVAGGLSTGVGSTWGFYWNVDVPILNVSPPSLTSSNGTTINAVTTGNNVQWGDPNPSGGTPFVDMNANGPDESFMVTIVVNGPPLMWDGGGQEGNNCPGGSGTNPENYEGDFPCLEPIVTPLPVFPVCEGSSVDIGVTIINTNLPGNMVTWMPGNLMGEVINVTPTETTVYTATIVNYCGEVTVDIEVEVVPTPSITAADDVLSICDGVPAVMEVFPQNAGPLVYWDPGGPGATFLVDIPPSLPFVYTATVYSTTLFGDVCDSASVDITVNEIFPPEVEIDGDPMTICNGESVTLIADTMFVDEVAWAPTAETTLEIEVSPTETTTYSVIAINECGIDTASVTIEVAGGAEETVNLSACEGETVDYNGIPLAAGSSSTFTYETAQGCDSIVTVVVAELLNSTFALELTACEGETVDYNGTPLSPGTTMDFTFVAANTCDSVVTVTVVELPTYAEPLSLEACTGTTVTYDGMELDPGTTMDFTFTADNGCDSVVTVTVNELQTFAVPLTLQTCTGTTIPYAGSQLAPGTTTDFTFTANNGCDSVVTVTVEELAIFTQDLELEACTGTTVSYDGMPLAPGSETDFTFVTSAGCDSVVTVTVIEVAAILDTVEFSACVGESIMFDGMSLNAGSTTDFPYITAAGCDSIVTVMVAELQTSASPLQLSSCSGETVMYDGVELDPGSVTDFVLPAANGCDSTVTVTVLEVLPTTEAMTLTACANETITFNGTVLDPGSVTDFAFTNYLGCDSTLTVSVDELPTYASPLSLQACTGSTISYNGVPLPPGTAIDFTLTAMNGCDSVVTVEVTEVETIEEDVNLATCPGSTIIFDGTPLAPNTVTDFTYQSYLGCDSVVTVTVDELDLITATLELDACANSSVLFDGMNLLPGSVTDFNYLTAAGCDSVLTVTVVELPTYASPLTLQACTGSTVTYDGVPLNPGSVTDFTLPASNGCDSVVTVTVDEVMILSENVDLQACIGTTVDYNGIPLAAGTTMDFTFTSSGGCDSIVTVTVEVILNVTGSENLQACTGTTVDYNGTTLTPGSMMTFNFTSWQGCDSIVTVIVEELFPQASALELETCEGSSILYAGQQLDAGTVTDVTLAAANGCDSVVTVTVQALDVVTGTETLQGCEGEALIYQGIEISPGTSMDFTLTSVNGCDSILTVTALEPLPIAETFEALEICEGASVEVFGQLVFTPGDYVQTFSGANGCDSIHTVTVNFGADLLLDLPEFIEINFGDDLELQPLINPLDDLVFSWEDDPTLSCVDCQNPIASPLENTTYFLTVSNPDGCMAEGDVQVFVRKKFGVYIPNSFSPNGDGINDIFMIFSDQKSVARINSFLVFSRWGEPVFEFYDFPPDDTQYGWDGFFRNEIMNPAVFVYMAEVEFIDGTVRLFKGDVTLAK